MRTTEIIHSRNMTITHRYVGMLLRSIPIHTLAPKVRGVGERQEWSPLLNDVSSVEVFWPPHKTMHTLDQKLLFASVVFSLCPPPVARMQRLLPTGLMQPELTQPTKQKMECKTNTPNRNVIWKRNTTKHKYADTHTTHHWEPSNRSNMHRVASKGCKPSIAETRNVESRCFHSSCSPWCRGQPMHQK